MSKFEALGVNKKLVKGLKDLKISTPTEIQEAVLPLLMSKNCDLVGQAQTGTGKTAAYGLPLLQRINVSDKFVQGLILCPTRELALQVAKQLFKFTKYTDKVFTESVYGGSYIGEQIKALKRPTHIVVATPGRLIDLMNRKSVDLSNVKTIILDEADEMLSMGFKKELDQVLNAIPSAQNKWLFSATIPHDIKKLIQVHLSSNAHRVEVSGRNVVNINIEHKFLVCDEKDKLEILLQFLKTERKNQGVVFCKTKAIAQKLAKQLQAKNISSDVIHGDLLQKERDKAMRAFKKGVARVLVATDLAARGIDVEGLTFVVHYQLPTKDEYYTHRSGRTARAGNTGLSLCLVSSKEVRQIRYYEKSLGIKFRQINQVK